MNTDFLWVEKYRPHTIADTILPEQLKQTFQTFVDQQNIPNLLLAGSAGVGKTTVARAMLEQLGCDYMIINGSLEGRQIDTLRNEIANFASSVSLTGGRKYLILDEADYLNPQSVQPALRNFMEDLSSNCGFILTCNYKNKIIEPLKSRCSLVDFRLRKEDRPEIAKQFMIRIMKILDAEGVKYEKPVVIEVIKQYFPDWRRVLNELQRYSASGAIDTGILANRADNSVEKIIPMFKERNFTALRKWVGENPDIQPEEIFTKLYQVGNEHIVKEDLPTFIIILAEYQHKAAFVANQEVNLAACFAQILGSVAFK
jgi:DNA polymerase III delta prime subunit